MKFYIKEARERAGYTQKELAQLIGVAANTFHGYESGKHDPKSDLLILIAKACSVSTDYLLGQTSNPEPSYLEQKEFTSHEQQLLSCYRSLNDEGKEKLVDYADDLVSSGKYKKDNPVDLASKEA